MRNVAAALAVLLVAGCAKTPMTEAEINREATRRCNAMGITIESDNYRDCIFKLTDVVQDEDRAAVQANAAAWRAAAAANSGGPIVPQTTRIQTTCTRVGISVICY